MQDVMNSSQNPSRSAGQGVESLDEQALNCARVLASFQADPMKLAGLSEQARAELLRAAGTLSRPHKEEIRQRNKAAARLLREQRAKKEKAARAQTGIRQARVGSVFVAPKKIELGENQTIENGQLETFKIESQQPLVSVDESINTRANENLNLKSVPEYLKHKISPQASEGKSRYAALSRDLYLQKPRNCYVCKAEFTKLHFFYDQLCEPCGDYNYDKRYQVAPMHGQVALITGARLKIGYQATLLMLRAGARVIATTRFPVDAALRFSKEEDYGTWKDQLQIHGLDLRHTPSVEIFARYIEQSYERLDVLINNAAQTVRRPPGFYAHLMKNEGLAYSDLPLDARQMMKNHHECLKELGHLCVETGAEKNTGQLVTWNSQGPGVGLRASAQLSQIPYSYDQSLSVEEVFPEGKLDADLQQVDLRETNTWRMKLGEVPIPELLEVQLVNAIAPFVLCNRLAPMMRRENTGVKHIVNVTAMEGKFYRFTKPDRHPHTNMAKAALNMLTHTSASDLAKDGIYMNAVDTGWVTDEDPAQIVQSKQAHHDFQPPLDIVDGAARLCDPFFLSINEGFHWSGKFLKDYQPIDW